MRPDIILVNGFIFPLQISQLRMILGKPVKIIILHRAEKPFTGIKRSLQQVADKCVNAYLFSSAEFGDIWLKSGIIKDKNKIHEVMQASSVFHSVNSESARIKLSIMGSPIFLWVGRLNKNKDPQTVVKAFMEYSGSNPQARLYMIYQTDELIDEILKITGGSENIILIGKIEHDQLQDWFNSADFIISGSHYEGSGIAVCEAMSCGCIPIVTNILSFRSLTGRGRCGILFEPGNVKDLHTALLKTGDMNLDIEKNKVLEQFKNELSFESIAGKINAILATI